MTNPDHISPSSVDYADQMRGLPVAAIAQQQELLGTAIGAIEGGFDPDNPAHADLRRRFTGAASLLRDVDTSSIDGASGQGAEDDEPQAAPSYALRVDGGVDIVTARGARSIDAGGRASSADTIKAYTSSRGVSGNTSATRKRPPMGPQGEPDTGRTVLFR